MKDNFFMTEKERDYVAESFLRNVKSLTSGIDYKSIFNNHAEKMPYPFSEETEKKKSVAGFGKDFKKALKTPQYHTGIAIDQLKSDIKLKYILEDFITKMIIQKFYTLNKSVTEDALNFVKMEFEEIVCFEKFFVLMNYLVKEINTQDLKSIYISLVNNYESIENVECLKDFLNTNIGKLPSVDYEEIPKVFIEKFMYQESGILLATSLLINNSELSGCFYYYIVVNNISYLEKENIWMFLAALIAFVDDDKKFKLVEITRNKIFELKKSDSEKFDNTKYFLKAIGLSKEDVL